ncbi:PLDc N-terminal domain-containing protein [Thermococcus pacificus]|uniref:Cardiolipin synthase N-terminal domain-containing protein n=1 Tax=Thermococcus pacificus TaxID=71998 RepID=A0A218P5H4_9EURY|nr:PLDc N-terminal domain-containing protein [Thermococcus pacificus]ASJ06018.1 hypothetical protein A3L08_01055 [Thermococcus pacificus]
MGEMAFFEIVWILGLTLMVAQLIALVWVIYDVMTKQKKMPDVEKVIWVLVAFFTTILGAIIYYILVKRTGKYEEGPGEHMENPDGPIVY